jgi:signal transduction histidine kinase
MKRVLIVDDKEDNVYYLKVLLKAQGWGVETARHGAEALELAREAPPDIVISDLLMPVMDGYTLLRHWKEDPRLKRVPFIVYTATYTDPDDEQLALNLGADAFILKPAEPDAFLDRVREVEASAVAAPLTPPHQPVADETHHFRGYSETLIRKLEEKMLQLETANQSLKRDLAQKQVMEAALKDSEQRFRQAQKMEAIGRLAGGVAHDFNNLLSVIIGYTSTILEDMKPDDPFRTDIEEVRRAGERATELTRQLMAFSRQQVMQPKVLDLSQTVLGMEKMLNRLLGEDVELSLVTPAAPVKTYADPSQVEQIVMNLAVNARDAMPRGGKLIIETANVELDATTASEHGGVVPGPYVMYSVADTGVGIDAATRERMFEPFFTTKEKGKGTGLGLATVFGIVNQSKGHILVSSEVGRGTTLKVFLPRTERPVDRDLPAPVAPTTVRGDEAILLVEDDAQVRVMTSAILRRHGYNVIDAQNGAEALLLSHQVGGPIDLLLTDLVMPKMSGPELADCLRPARPQMRVIYLSGYTEESIIQYGPTDAGLVFLQKPITPDALVRQVRAVLDGASAA